ncbi:GNAT family N-acetyltransferase [Dyella ginsengisoli]|uniref:GNAT family N-acetyltransferase n=1 Tax=Dyella ginsengisoli TaxID=363848 RepID=A0ABW8JX50_9GAMM
MTTPLRIRPVTDADFAPWLVLWEGYNAFYGRHGASALDPAITRVSWQRFLDPAESMFACVAEVDGALCGLVHFLHHRSTTRIEPVCYLQDLFTAEAARGRGIARALIEHVYAHARAAGVRRVYWQTQAGNATARALYDRLARHAGFIVYAHDL